ncbi:MAG: TrkA C-terminal domain-containing protein [Bacteroidota bacterium]
MVGIITLVIILAVSLLITRIATIALTHTGLSRQSAKFQARSAFTGVGFTTSESEKVVSNPVRRRILLGLMLLGNAGIVTGIASLIVGFTSGAEESKMWVRVIVLAAGLSLLWTLAQSNWVDKKLSVIINKFLKKYTRLDISDYASLLHLSGDYRIAEIGIDEKHWLLGKTLRNCKLRDEGMIVLGITRSDGTYIGAPQADTEIHKYDILTIYGRTKAMSNLEKRTQTSRGDKAHDKMIKEQEAIVEKERKEDRKKEDV